MWEDECGRVNIGESECGRVSKPSIQTRTDLSCPGQAFSG